MSQADHLPAAAATGTVETLDAAVADLLLPFAELGPVRTIGDLSDFCDQEPLYAAAGATLATAAVLRDGRTWRAGTRMLASHLLATALRRIVKQMVDRTRPDAAARRGDYVLREGRRHDGDFNSFPSGHTAGAIAFARSVGRHYPGSHHAVLALAGLASVAQVVRSRHFVTDVLAGAAIGLVAEAIVDRLIRRAEQV